jgi:hypothetical protein
MRCRTIGSVGTVKATGQFPHPLRTLQTVARSLPLRLIPAWCDGSAQADPDRLGQPVFGMRFLNRFSCPIKVPRPRFGQCLSSVARLIAS